MTGPNAVFMGDDISSGRQLVDVYRNSCVWDSCLFIAVGKDDVVGKYLVESLQAQPASVDGLALTTEEWTEKVEACNRMDTDTHPPAGVAAELDGDLAAELAADVAARYAAELAEELTNPPAGDIDITHLPPRPHLPAGIVGIANGISGLPRAPLPPVGFGNGISGLPRAPAPPARATVLAGVRAGINDSRIRHPHLANSAEVVGNVIPVVAPVLVPLADVAPDLDPLARADGWVISVRVSGSGGRIVNVAAPDSDPPVAADRGHPSGRRPVGRPPMGYGRGRGRGRGGGRGGRGVPVVFGEVHPVTVVDRPVASRPVGRPPMGHARGRGRGGGAAGATGGGRGGSARIEATPESAAGGDSVMSSEDGSDMNDISDDEDYEVGS